MGAERTQLGACRPRLPGSPSAHPAPGLPLSVLGLWVFCSCRRRWTETCVYMANSAATDFLRLLSLPRVLPTLGQELGDCEGPLCGVPRGFCHVNPYRNTGLPVAIPRTATPPRAPPAGSGLAQPPPGHLHWPGLWLLVSGTVVLVASLPPADENFHFGQGHTRAIKTVAFSLPCVSISPLTLSLGSAPGGRPHPQRPPRHGRQPGHLRALCPPSARGLSGQACGQADKCSLPHHPARL